MWSAYHGIATFVSLVATARALQAIRWQTWWLVTAAVSLAPLPLVLRHVLPEALPQTGAPVWPGALSAVGGGLNAVGAVLTALVRLAVALASCWRCYWASAR